MPPDASYLKMIYDYAPALGVAVGIVVILLGAVGRMFGVTAIFSKSQIVDDSKIATVTSGVAEINSKLDTIENRMSTVERDLTQRATRDEVHKLELAVTRVETEMRGQGITIQAISSGVSRIQDFMYEAAVRHKRGD